MKVSIAAIIILAGLGGFAIGETSYIWNQIDYGAAPNLGTTITDINNANQITGTSWDGRFAYLRNPNGEMSYLYIKPDASTGTHARSYGNAINAAGDVVTTGGGSMTGNVYKPCLFTNITPPSHAYDPITMGVSGDRASAINATYIAGYLADGLQGSYDAAIWPFDSNDVVYSYDVWSHAKYVDVSQNNVFVGQHWNPSSGAYTSSFITQHDGSNWTTSSLQFASYTTTQIKSINGDGSLMCGFLQTAWGSNYSQAAVFTYDTASGTFERLQNLAQSNGTISSADAISSNGKYIVGRAAGVPVLWSDEQGDGSYIQTNIADLMPAGEYANWTNIVLTGVNDWGSIVGYGNYDSQAYTSGFFMELHAPLTCQEMYAVGYALPGDVNQDCYVNLTDFAAMAHSWQECINPEDANCDMLWN